MWKTFMFALYIERTIQKKAEKTRKKWICVHVDRSMWKMRTRFTQKVCGK